MRWPGLGLIGVVALAALAGACTANPVSSPGTVASPSASASTSLQTLDPSATFWPTGSIDGTIALGAADSDFAQMASDVVAAVDANEPARILQVMTDALTFLKANQANIALLQAYPATKPVGDQLAAAYAQMVNGAQAVVDGLRNGDGAAAQTGFTTFFSGNSAYVAARGALGDLASQAILMKRGLLK